MRRGALRRAFLPVFAALLFVFPASPAEGVGVRVEGVRHHLSDGHCRIVVDLSSRASFDHKRLVGPDRIYFDIKNSRVSEGVESRVEVEGGILRGIRVSQYRPGTVRMVLDVGEVESYDVFELEDPSRMVIDLYGNAPAPSANTASLDPTNAPVDDAPADVPPAVPARAIGLKRVVIDPGHGGKDPGAVHRGMMEKDVVLDISLRLKNALEKMGGYEVLLTRSKDEYLSLEERTVIANRFGADLFVSVHLNANRKSSLEGIETYMLNWTDNAEAMRVAARENKISLNRMQEAGSELGVILASLQRQNKRDESLRVAHYIQESIVSSLRLKYSGVVDNGVKQALFYVLLGAKMPAVLVEASYMTNRSEATRLNTGVYRQHIAEGIASGIETYFGSARPVQEIAQR